MDALTCGICLDHLRVPVCTPCGHLCCEACLTAHIEASADAMNALCPTCRSSFSIAVPDPRFITQKYRSFILPSIRRVFIATDPDAAPNPASEARRDLHAQIAQLTDRVNGLLHDKTLLMDRCEAAMRASHAHAQGERDMRLQKEKLEHEMRELRRKYDTVKGKYKHLKTSSQQQENVNPPVRAAPSFALSMKRKSRGTDAFDTSCSYDPLSGPRDPATHTHAADNSKKERPITRFAKRPRLLGSPFDLSKRIETRQQHTSHGQSRRLFDEDEEGDSSFSLRESDLSSSGGPQRSGLPTGDIFSPGQGSARGGRGSISFDFEDTGGGMPRRLGTMRPAWMLSPEEELPCVEWNA